MQRDQLFYFPQRQEMNVNRKTQECVESVAYVFF